jgi:hypothetical protein
MNGIPASRASLLTSATSPPREQIIAMLPPRKVLDRYISHVFNVFDVSSCVLHRHKFMAEYTEFWTNPSAASVMWIGLLFSLSCLSVFLRRQENPLLNPFAQEVDDNLEMYRTLTIHCLISGDYLRPSKYTMETLIFHFAVDQNVTVDTNIANWMLIGVIIRVALRMGLHRDPSHWPNISPLQAELRRRIWNTLYHMDFFTSVQVGLPRIIKDTQCDVLPPKNLLDDDISLENGELPPERPLTESNPISYLILRQRVIVVAAEIYDKIEAALPTCGTIEELHLKLDQAIESIPEWLRYKSSEVSLAEKPVTILYQMIFDIIIHKAFYLLHRRNFIKEPLGEDNTKSIEQCIDSALAVLGHQRRMAEEIEPGGLLFNYRWKVAKSLNHEFLQATMMLCLALSRFNTNAREPSTLHRRECIIQALKSAKDIWEESADQSIEARRAAAAIEKVLKQDSDKMDDNTSFAHTIDQGWRVQQGYLPDPTEQIRQYDSFTDPSTMQNYSDSFDYRQHTLVDPSLFDGNIDMSLFENITDSFVDTI